MFTGQKTHILQKINVNAPKPNSGWVLSGLNLDPKLIILFTKTKHHIHTSLD